MPVPNSDDTERRDSDGMSGPGTGRTRGPATQAPGEGRAATLGEFEAIERLATRLCAGGHRPPPEEVWIGDDAAVLGEPGGPLLVTTDLVVEGVHADLAFLSLADLGWRAMVASVSDIAAMGGRPAHCVVAVAAPPSVDLEALYDGVAEAAEVYRCPVVGGDLSSAPLVVMAVTMTGGLRPGAAPVLRSGARPGDRLFVSGPLGASALGLRLLRQRRAAASIPADADADADADAHDADADAAHADADADAADAAVAAHRRPRAHPGAGEAARLGGVRAMVDVSDGLSGDLTRMADASGVGFRLGEVPVADGADLDDALSGGEDYELIMASPDPEALLRSFDRAGLSAPFEIGVCVAHTGERTIGGVPLAPGGFEHRFGSGSRDASGHGR